MHCAYRARVLVILLAGVHAAGCEDDGDSCGEWVAFQTVDQGPQSGYYLPYQSRPYLFVFRSQPEWEAFWTQSL